MDKNAPLVLPKYTNDQQYADEASKPGVLVLDVFAKFAGPCEAMLNVFKKFKMEFTDTIRFAQAQADDIQSLESYRNRSIPTFLIIHSGVLVNIVRGANSPLIDANIREQIDRFKKGNEPIPMEGVAQIKVNKQLVVPVAAAPKKSVADLTAAESDVTLALIKPDAYGKASVIVDAIRQKDFTIAQEKHFIFTKEQAQRFYSDHRDKPFFQSLVKFMTSGPVVGLVLSKPNAIQDWRTAMGPTNARRAKEETPQSLRALFGTDGQRNAVHGSDSSANVTKEIGVVFDEAVKEIIAPFAKRNNEAAKVEQSLLIIQPELISPAESDDNTQLDENHPIPFIDSFSENTQEILGNVLYHVALNNLSIVKAEKLIPNQRQSSLLFWGCGSKSSEKAANLSSGFIVALLISGDHAVAELQRISKVLIADSRSDDVKTGFYAPESSVEAYRQIDLFFPYNSLNSVKPSSANQVEKTVALIKPDVVKSNRVDQVLQMIKIQGLEIKSTREVKFTQEKVAEFYKEHVSKPYFSSLVGFLTSAPSIALILEAPDAVVKWRALMGPSDCEKAREIAPNSIRAFFASNVLENAVYGSDSAIIVSRDIDFFFNESVAAKAAAEQEQADKAVAEQAAAAAAPQLAKSAAKISNSKDALKSTELSKSVNKLSGSKEALNVGSTKDLAKSKTNINGSNQKLTERKTPSVSKLSSSRPSSSGKLQEPTPVKSVSKSSLQTPSKTNLTASKSQSAIGGSKSALMQAASKSALSASKARLASNKSLAAGAQSNSATNEQSVGKS